MRDSNKKGKNTKYYIIGGSLIALLVIVSLVAYSPWSPYSYWWLKEEQEPTTPEKALSTFTFIDYCTGEVVSSWVEGTILVPKSTADFDQDDDPYTFSNFESEITSKDGDDISIDLRPYPYAYLIVDPDDDSNYGGYDVEYGGCLSDDHRFLFGGENHDYVVWVYHLPTNVTINVLDRNDSDEWDLVSDGDYTVYMDLIENSTEGLHLQGEIAGEEWELTEEMYDDYSTSEIAWLRNQRNHRTEAPFYDMVDDLDKGYDDELEYLTNAFVVQFTFNDSISEIDGADTEVNFTLTQRNFEKYPIKVVYSDTYIYCIYYEPITWVYELQSFDFRIDMAVNITGTTVWTGRLEIPYDASPLGAFVGLAPAPL